MLFDLIDRWASWWLDWRADCAAAKSGSAEAGFKRAEFDQTGFHMVASFPGVYILADETAEEWQIWVAVFGARVREALGEIEEKTGGVGG